MAANNRYLNSAKTFVEKFPPGAVYAMTAVEAFLGELSTGANGYQRDPAFAPNLHIFDPDERRTAIIKALNSAGKEADFRIHDLKDGSSIDVQKYSEYALDGASPGIQIGKLERLIKDTNKKASALNDLHDLSEADSEKAEIRKEALAKLVEEAKKTVTASKEHNFIATAKHLGITAEVARKLLPHMDELMGTSKKR